MTTQTIPPVKRAISVSWTPEAAFRRFTAELDTWWPRHTHSVGEHKVRRLVFETHVGGKIYEEHVDGRRFQWGEVLAWEPPGRVVFTWHPSKAPETAQDVELLFIPEGTGTRLELTSIGWERYGKDARKAQRGHHMGWGYVLDIWAGRRPPMMFVVTALTQVLRVVQWARGGLDVAINKAEGEMPRASAG